MHREEICERIRCALNGVDQLSYLTTEELIEGTDVPINFAGKKIAKLARKDAPGLSVTVEEWSRAQTGGTVWRIEPTEDDGHGSTPSDAYGSGAERRSRT
jgi:hypothetical protein